MTSSQTDDRVEAVRRNTVKKCIAWLHAEAARMNDPHARSVLNNAAFHMGVQFKVRDDDALSAPGEGWRPMTVEPPNRTEAVIERMNGSRSLATWDRGGRGLARGWWSGPWRTDESNVRAYFVLPAPPKEDGHG